ncbi:hypothetical protein ABID46_001115 [Moheibacter stercoris]|uniref:Uncharacterized protein n=1 Tax=Moheibacter stercoris TaxID=1628251 RepID=A0ABV2LSI9_9FLAO
MEWLFLIKKNKNHSRFPTVIWLKKNKSIIDYCANAMVITEIFASGYSV